ncbi:alpha/beta hydrolase [Pseudoroseicyclus sp. CXY001]|uniref:alpha/beta hydrolase n=1 Tax=Pseudoroseicyclus sp. CXY001 TaxID=3242492 RepID=UPI00358DD1E0
MADLYRNRDFIPDFDEIMAETEARSREVAARADVRPGLPYGDTPRQSFDLVLPPRVAPGAPLHVFIHGGYWRAGSKEAHTLVAQPVLEAGGICALVTYDLMPGTRLGAIVGQVRAAVRAAAAEAAGLGADPGRLTVSGHSAGAHLASLLAAEAPGDAGPPDVPPLAGLLLVSGIYDLAGIPDSFLKDEAKMTHEEAADWSPLSARPLPAGRRIFTCGEAETAPFHVQAAAMDELYERAGMRSALRVEPGCNHLTVVFDLADTSRLLGQALADLVAGS